MIRKALIFFLILGLWTRPAHAVGLSMRFTDVTLENVEPGTHINLRVSRNLPMILHNQSDTEDTDVVIEPLLPNARELKDGYEPVPDLTWIQSIPDHFHLGPQASASVDVLLNVPTDPKYVGHHYEVILWAHTDQKNKSLATGGVLFQVGLHARFRLSIGTKGPASLQREKLLKKLETINTNFSLSPDNLFVRDIPLGVSLDLKTDKKAALKVVNQSDDPVSLKVHAIAPDPNVYPQAGYENVPDFTWLDISPTVIKVNPNSIKELKMHLKIPNDPKYKGKNYMFLIQTTLADESIPLSYYNMVYITTAP